DSQHDVYHHQRRGRHEFRRAGVRARRRPRSVGRPGHGRPGVHLRADPELLLHGDRVRTTVLRTPSRVGALKLADFDYLLPRELIAQVPARPRDSARLLVLDRATGGGAHRVFRELAEYLRPADVLVLNDTRVLPARLRARRPTGGTVEVLGPQAGGQDSGVVEHQDI